MDNCPYDQIPIKRNAPTIKCPSCGRVYHKECWIENGNKCCILGCQGQKSLKAAIHWRWLLGTIFLLIIIGGGYNIVSGIIEKVIHPYGLSKPVISDSIRSTPTNSKTVNLQPSNTSNPFPTITKVKTSTQKPTIVAISTKIGNKWNACQGAYYPSRLQVNSFGFVTYDPPYRNNVRSKPNLNGELVGQISPGEKFRIIDGPECSNHWVWWKIRSLSSFVIGWTSEGDEKDYWLVPEGLDK